VKNWGGRKIYRDGGGENLGGETKGEKPKPRKKTISLKRPPRPSPSSLRTKWPGRHFSPTFALKANQRNPTQIDRRRRSPSDPSLHPISLCWSSTQWRPPPPFEDKKPEFSSSGLSQKTKKAPSLFLSPAATNPPLWPAIFAPETAPLALTKQARESPSAKKKKHWPSLSCSSSRLNREPSATGQQSTHRPPSPGWRHRRPAKTAPLRTTEQPHLPRPENGQGRSPSPQTHGSRFSQQVFPSSAAEQPPAAATTQQRPQTGSPWSCHRHLKQKKRKQKNLQRCSRSEQGEGREADLKTKKEN